MTQINFFRMRSLLVLGIRELRDVENLAKQDLAEKRSLVEKHPMLLRHPIS